MKTIGVVANLTGKFFAKDMNGNVIELKNGDSIIEGMTVFGDSLNSATDVINIALNNNQNISLFSNQKQLFDNSMVDDIQDITEDNVNESSFDDFIKLLASAQAQEEGEEIAEEETTEGNEEIKESGEDTASFSARDGSATDVISDLRNARFKQKSTTFEVKSKFATETDGLEQNNTESKNAFYIPVERPTSTGTTTAEPIPQPEPSPLEPTPVPHIPTIVTLKLFAINSLGKEVPANDANEGEIVEYVVRAFDGNTIVNLTGTVKIVFGDITANGNQTQTLNDGTQDYNNTPQTVTVGEKFNTSIFDDYISDNGEIYEVSIVDQSYIGSKGGFDIVIHDTTPVTTTIQDNSKPVDENTPHNPNDTTNHITEGDKEIVTIKLFAADSNGNVLKDGNGDYLSANSVLEGNEGNYIAYAFDFGTTQFNDSTKLDMQVGKVNVNFSDSTANGVGTQTLTNGTQDFNNTTQTITLGQSFSTEVFNDIINEGNENYTVNIVDGSYAQDSLNGGYESVTIDTAPVTTTISDLTSKVFVKIELVDGIANESENLKYKVVLVDENGVEVTVPSGKTVTVTLNYDIDGNINTNDATENGDYTPVTTVNITAGNSSQEFDISTIDDYFAEGDEVLKITIDSVTNPDNIFESILPHTIANGASSDKDSVLGTIKDNPANDTQNPDTPVEVGGYGDEDSIYVKITHNDSTVEGGDLTHTVTLVDKDGNLVTVPVGEKITVTLTYTSTTGNVTDNDFTTIVKTVDIEGGNSGTTITNITKDDFVGEGDEVYTLTITDVTQENGTFENVAIHTTENSVTGTIRDGVTLGVPTNADVDEDDFDVTVTGSTISDTESLNIVAPNDDNGYTLSFDGNPIFTSDNIAYTDLTSGGTVIEYVVNGNTTTGYLGSGRTTADKVFEIVLNKNGVGGADDDYTYTQYKNIDHPTVNSDDDVVLTFGYKITDGSAVSNVQTFTVTVNDSLPFSTPQNVSLNEDGTKLIVISDESFNNGEITLNNGISGDQVVASGGSIAIYDVELNDIVGILTNNGNGTLTFTPAEDYSGDTAGFSYTVSDRDGDTVTSTVAITVNPVVDTPTVNVNDVSTTEDNSNTAEGTHSVALGLTLPSLSKDQTDKNSITGTQAGDHPERNGYVELKFANGSSVSGAVLEKGDGTDLATISSNNQTIKIYISDLGTNYHHSDLDPVADGAISLTQAEYEALKIIHAEDNDKDIGINISVTSYEVDDSGIPLSGVAGVKDEDNMSVKIAPVTDDISLAWDNNASGLGTYVGDTFTFNTVDEGGYFTTSIDLKSLLTKTSGYESDATGDLDGTEKRTYIIEGIPEGSIVTLGGQSTTANASGVATIVFNDTNNKLEDPSFTLQLPEQYSGTITNAKITLSVQDNGADSSDTAGAIKTDEVYFNVTVNSIADIATLQIKQAIGNEDAGRSVGNTADNSSTIDEPQNGITLDIKVSSDDKDNSETFIVRIDDIPNGGSLYVYDNSASTWKLVDNTDAGTDGNLTITDNGDGTWKIVIEDFQNDQLPKFIPPHNSDEDYIFKINAQTVDGSNTWNDTWLTLSDKDMQVTVKDTADVPVGTDLNAISQNGETYALVLNENTDLDSGVNKFDLKDVYVNSTLLDSYDSDSETLSIVISNLPSGFGVEGASLIGNGVWTFLYSDINSVKITTPANFSGEATFNLKYITTEDAGDSKTHYTDTVKIFVSPSAEATIGTATTASEDVLTKVDFSIAHQNGDTNETLEEVRIKVDDVEGKDFTLYLGSDGSTTLANAGLSVVGGYYILTAIQANNVYALNTTEHEHGSYTFEVGYTVRDTESDKNTYDEITGTINYALTINAVTDIPTATLETISGGTGYSVNGSTVSVSAEDTTFSIPVKLTSPDMDGSESVTRYVITGVPMGVEVVGGTYYGYAGSVHNGIWVLDIADTAINDANGHTENIQFKVNYGADYETRNITIEAFNQDSGASEESDSVTFTLEKTYTATGGTGTPPEFTLSALEVDILEDSAFNLGSAVDVTKTGGGLSGGFAVTITDLPEGSSVSGHSYSYVENGVTRYVITGTGGNAADVEAALSAVSITPPANINDSDSSTQSMTFTATIATYHNGTFYSGNTLNYSEHILPVTDDMTIAINASGTDEDVSTNFTITLSNDADTVTEIIGGKLYIKVTENYEAGETDLGSLEYQGSTLVAQSNPDGLTGDYYVIDISSYTMGTPLSFTFNPGDNRHGNVTIEAVVKNKEGHGWDTGVHDTAIQTSTGSTTIAVSPVIDGFDAQDVADSIGNESSGADLNKIRLDINATLSDPSESLASATLDKIPNGFLIYFGPDADHLTLATNTGTSGSDTFVINPNGDNVAVSYNQWLIPLTSGALPAHIWIQAPQNWSGVLEDVILNLFGLSDGGVTTNESHTFDVTFTPVSDGVTIDPTLTFGKVYDWVDLKLNANMSDVDGSETMSLEISGLNQSAAFRLNDGTLIDATYADNKWTLENISYDEINNIQLAHDLSVGSVTVKAWTVDGTSESSFVTDTFTLTLSSNGTVVGTTGDDMLVYNPSATLINGTDGDDSLVLLGGAGLDFDSSVASISNVEKINLGVSGANSITNLKLSDVVSMTDSDNQLIIDGDSSDSVTFKNQNEWTKGASDGTYTTYTNSNDASVTLKIDNEIQQPIN